jgi:single-stranded DNA-specific DHH superfamily exonuclease
MKYMQDAVRFLGEIKDSDEIVVVFNNDGDGICSCTLVLDYLEKTGKKRPYIINQPMPMDKNLVQRIKTTVPNKIIFVDLVVDQQEDLLGKIRGLADVLIVDHHQIVKDLNMLRRGKDSPALVHFNPRFTKNGIYTSATYNIYKITSELADMSNRLWLAAVGMVSDYNLEDSQDLVGKVREKYGIENDLYASRIGRIADMIFSANATKDLSCEQMVEIFLRTKDLPDLENVEGYDKLVKSYHTIQEEIENILSDAAANSVRSGNVVMYNLKSKFNLNSVISTKISERHLDRLVLVFSKSGNRYKVSARNQKKNINASRVMQAATKGLKASGGGHEAAAGATIDENDWEAFKQRVQEIVNG